MAVADAENCLGSLVPLSNFRTVKTLAVIYFTRVESYKALFDEKLVLTHDYLNDIKFGVYNQLKIRVVFSTDLNINTSVTVVQV